jgi:hypothetical protein
MKQGYEGITISGAMLVVAFAAIAVAKWLF